jgi:transposase, IS30 family
MGKIYSQLGFEERVLIGHLHADGLSKRKIGLQLERSASTISRELHRGGKPLKSACLSYDATSAQGRAKARRRRISRFKMARLLSLTKGGPA